MAKKILSICMAILCSLNISYATVGIPDDSTTEGETVSETQEDSGSMDDGITFNPNNSTETTELHNQNKEKLDGMQNSFEEDAGGSKYDDEYAYYKVGNLTEKPELESPSSVLMDASSGFVLYNSSANEKKYPASMTKVMTALIAIENGNLDDVITYSENAVNIPDDATKAGFSAGDKVTLRESLYALFMASAADASIAIAEHIGGNVENFVDMMNTKAQAIGCSQTNFVNPHGLHDANHYTTAYDMALIMQCAISYPDFCDIIGTKSYTIKKSDVVKNEIKLENRSALLSEGNANYYEFAKGSKTGHTNAAKYTLVSYAEKNGAKFVSVVMEGDSFDTCYLDTKRLFEWGYNKTQTIHPMPDSSEIDGILMEAVTDDKYEKIKYLSLQYMPDYGILTNNAVNRDAIRCFFTLDEDMTNGILGYLNVTYYDKILIGRTPILYDTDTSQYQEYLKLYNVGVDEKPIEVIPQDDYTDDSNQDNMPVDGNETEEEEGNPLISDSAFDLAIQFIIIYGLAMIVLCMVTYIIIIIRRKKGY